MSDPVRLGPYLDIVAEDILTRVTRDNFCAVSVNDGESNRWSDPTTDMDSAVSGLKPFAGTLVVRRKPKPKPSALTPLYVFNWVTGGYNQVYANTKSEARKLIAKDFPHMQPDLKTMRRLTTRADINGYWKSNRYCS